MPWPCRINYYLIELNSGVGEKYVNYNKSIADCTGIRNIKRSLKERSTNDLNKDYNSILCRYIREQGGIDNFGIYFIDPNYIAKTELDLINRLDELIEKNGAKLTLREPDIDEITCCHNQYRAFCHICSIMCSHKSDSETCPKCCVKYAQKSLANELVDLNNQRRNKIYEFYVYSFLKTNTRFIGFYRGEDKTEDEIYRIANGINPIIQKRNKEKSKIAIMNNMSKTSFGRELLTNRGGGMYNQYLFATVEKFEDAYSPDVRQMILREKHEAFLLNEIMPKCNHRGFARECLCKICYYADKNIMNYFEKMIELRDKGVFSGEDLDIVNKIEEERNRLIGRIINIEN